VAKQAKKPEPLLRKQDFSSYLESKARELAPRDVEVLLLEADKARESAFRLSDRIGRRMSIALELLADHHSGECPQIPFYTVSLLAEAVYYFLDPNDVIPDWIPDIGRLDDALVVELSFELGADGVRRYCAWKGIDDHDLYPVPEAPGRGAPKPAKKKAAARSKKSGAAPKKSKKAAKPAATQGPKKAAKAAAKKRKSRKS
jgi:uncharacterized membrane protein YkvA (DUF1232 family)